MSEAVVVPFVLGLLIFSVAVGIWFSSAAIGWMLVGGGFLCMAAINAYIEHKNSK